MKEFDRVIMRYFEENQLGTDYLLTFTERYSHTIAGIQNMDLISKIYDLARFAVWVINKDFFMRAIEKLFRIDKYAINYFLHRVLGAFEFVAISSTNPDIPVRLIEKIILHGQYGAWGYFLHPVIARIGLLSDEGFKKSLLELIGRSAWAKNDSHEWLTVFKERLELLVPETPPGFSVDYNKQWTECAVTQINALLTSPDSPISSSPNPFELLKTKILHIIRNASCSY